MTPSTRTDDGFGFPTSPKQTLAGEHNVDASVGSPGRQDLLSHSIDIGRGGGSAGFMGKVSEISWLAQASSYLVTSPDKHSARRKNVPGQECIDYLNYLMDDEDLLSIDEDS
ncbi:hypothetical protein H2202_011304, partial [Exophiala xenobiotica]